MLSHVGSGSPDNGLGKQPYLSGTANCDQAGYHAATHRCDDAAPALMNSRRCFSYRMELRADAD